MKKDTQNIIKECLNTTISENKDEKCSPSTPSGGHRQKINDEKALMTPARHRNEKGGTNLEKLENILDNTGENNMNINVSTKCEFTKKGVCINHGTTSTKIVVPSKKWKDRGGGKGYGYVTTRVTKNICTARKSLPADTNISTNNLIADMARDSLGFISNIGISDVSTEHSRKLED